MKKVMVLGLVASFFFQSAAFALESWQMHIKPYECSDSHKGGIWQFAPTAGLLSTSETLSAANESSADVLAGLDCTKAYECTVKAYRQAAVSEVPGTIGGNTAHLWMVYKIQNCHES